MTTRNYHTFRRKPLFNNAISELSRNVLKFIYIATYSIYNNKVSVTMNSIFGSNDTNNNLNLIIFDASKNERKLNEEFKILQRKLKSKWKFIE